MRKKDKDNDNDNETGLSIPDSNTLVPNVGDKAVVEYEKHETTTVARVTKPDANKVTYTIYDSTGTIVATASSKRK